MAYLLDCGDVRERFIDSNYVRGTRTEDVFAFDAFLLLSRTASLNVRRVILVELSTVALYSLVGL